MAVFHKIKSHFKNNKTYFNIMNTKIKKYDKCKKKIKVNKK